MKAIIKTVAMNKDRNTTVNGVAKTFKDNQLIFRVQGTEDEIAKFKAWALATYKKELVCDKTGDLLYFQWGDPTAPVAELQMFEKDGQLKCFVPKSTELMLLKQDLERAEAMEDDDAIDKAINRYNAKRAKLYDALKAYGANAIAELTGSTDSTVGEF